MISTNPEFLIIEEYHAFLNHESFPCIAAKAALAKQQAKCLVADHLACPHNDGSILQFLYDFVDVYRSSGELYHSAAIIFKGPEDIDESSFDKFLWMRLQSLSNMDAMNYSYDERVNKDPHSSEFSFSLKQEAFFVIGLHPAGSRPARQFKYPTLVFNPHAQFEQLKHNGKFEKMQEVVRKRDLNHSGSINPMLDNYGASSEAYQYSGRVYDDKWKCPLNTTWRT